MLVRLLPGLLIAIVLGVLFNVPSRRADSGGAKPRASLFEEEGSRSSRYKIRNEDKSGTFDRADGSLATGREEAGNREAFFTPKNPRSENTGRTEENVIAEEIRLMAAPAVARKDAVGKMAGHFNGGALRPTISRTAFRLGNGYQGIASHTAFASAGVGDPAVGTSYLQPPDRGLRLWGHERIFSERQKDRNIGLSNYSFDGNVHSAGLKKDWSVDSIIGLSLDYLDGKLKSGHSADTRKDDISGYLVNAHYDGLLMYKYPFDLKFVYGRVENQTKALVYYPGSPVVDDWKDDKHKSDVYGFSANIGVPLIAPGGLKLLTEFGLDYRKLRGKAYSYRLNGAEVEVPKSSATSLMMPVSLTVSRDYIHSWGLVAPRLNLGMSFEFDESALGVRTLNSNAAARVSSIPGVIADIERDTAQDSFYHIGVGVDIKTVGGWEIGAGYTRYLAEKYHQNEFRLELGRCF